MPRGPSQGTRAQAPPIIIQQQIHGIAGTPPQMMYTLPSVCPSTSAGDLIGDPSPLHFQSSSFMSPVLDAVQDQLGQTPQPQGHTFFTTAGFSSPLGSKPQVRIFFLPIQTKEFLTPTFQHNLTFQSNQFIVLS